MAESGFRAFQRAKLSPQDMLLNTISGIYLPKTKSNTVKPILRDHSKNLVFKTDYRLMQTKSIEVCSKGSVLQYFLPLNYQLSLSSFLSIFDWSLKTDFTVTKTPILAASSCTHMRICVHVGTPMSIDTIRYTL